MFSISMSILANGNHLREHSAQSSKIRDESVDRVPSSSSNKRIRSDRDRKKVVVRIAIEAADESSNSGSAKRLDQLTDQLVPVSKSQCNESCRDRGPRSPDLDKEDNSDHRDRARAFAAGNCRS